MKQNKSWIIMLFGICEKMVYTINFVKYMLINYTHRNVFVCVCLDLKL